jgi:thiamine biosynthesis lipoprotein
MPVETRFRAMGTDVHIVVVGSPHLLSLARRRMLDLEQRWSRFLADSEISTLNRSGGRLAVVSPETYDIVALALAAWAETDGLFDPTVLGDLLRAGYVRSFSSLPSDGDAVEPPRTPGRRGAGRIASIPAVNGVVMPVGVGLDLGGIGKGRAADLVASELMEAGASGACVNVGGDLRVVGRHRAGPTAAETDWTVGIDDPVDDRQVALLALAAGAVATTSRIKRVWTVDGEVRHHVIDPRTGRPAIGGVASVSVVAAQCWQAEVLAKVAFLSGPDHCFDRVDAAGAAALVILDDGAVLHSAGLASFLVDDRGGRPDGGPWPARPEGCQPGGSQPEGSQLARPEGSQPGSQP